jgi:hypothetical protein
MIYVEIDEDDFIDRMNKAHQFATHGFSHDGSEFENSPVPNRLFLLFRTRIHISKNVLSLLASPF